MHILSCLLGAIPARFGSWNKDLFAAPGLVLRLPDRSPGVIAGWSNFVTPIAKNPSAEGISRAGMFDATEEFCWHAAGIKTKRDQNKPHRKKENQPCALHWVGLL